MGVGAGTLNQDQITNVFKRCGQFNYVNGRENHLVKIQGVPDYKPPEKSDPWLVDPLKNSFIQCPYKQMHRKTLQIIDKVVF